MVYAGGIAISLTDAKAIEEVVQHSKNVNDKYKRFDISISIKTA
jgi:hypothetical protein